MNSQAYNKVYNAIKEQIIDCFYVPGQKLPPERVLCEQFGVSRITARHALRLLEEQGLVERFRGRGTFIRAARPKKIPILNCDFTGSVRKEAPNMERKLLAKADITPPPHIAKILGLEKSQQCLLAMRLDLLDNEPLAFDRAYILSECSESFDDELLTAIDFLERWLDQEGLKISYFIENIEAIESDKQSATYLGVSTSSAMLLATDICYDTNKRAIAVFESVYRGDRIKLVSTTEKGTANVKAAY